MDDANSTGLILNIVGIGEISFPDYTQEEYLQREIIFAAFVLLFCGSFLVLQILVMRAVWKERDMRKLPAYQIMMAIGLMDTIQLIVHLTAVFYIVSSSPHFDTIDFEIGAVMNASWVCMLLLSVLLNANRLLSIVFPFTARIFFTPKMLSAQFGVCCVLWMVNFVVNTLGMSRMVYLLPAYTWHYIADCPYSALVRSLSAYLSLVDVGFAIFAHSIMFPYIYVKAAIFSKKEIILTVQVLCVSLFHIWGYLTWEYLPIPWELPIGVFLGHVVWMVWNSINPLLYICLNPRIRASVMFQLFGGKASRVASWAQPSQTSSARPS